MKCSNTRTTQYNKMPNYITNSNLRLPNQEVANKRQKVLIRMHLSFLKHPTNTSLHMWKERHINNNMKHKIKTCYSKTNSTPPKQNKQDSHISFISPLFCHVLTKTTQTKVNRKHTQQKSKENRESRKQMNPALQRIEATPPIRSNNSL